MDERQNADVPSSNAEDSKTRPVQQDEQVSQAAKTTVARRDLSSVEVPGVIPVDETVLRPRAEDDPDRFLRRTRDYDHDAQSVNTVASAERFDTIKEKRSWWDARRDPYARSSKRGNAPGEGNSRSKLRPLLALLIIAIVVAGGGAVLSYGMEMWGGKTVPGVIGESQAKAELALGDKGFVVVVEAEPADDAIGKVLSQDPVVGTRVPEGSKVTIVVATNRTMPEVVGLFEDEARWTLANAGAEIIETQKVASSAPEGTVIAVSPEAGSPFVSRSAVTLSVATPFRVPDVVGKKESDAVAELQAAGFATEVSYVVSENTVRTVVETVPVAGSTIDEGGTVQVKVATPYPANPLHLAEYFGHSSQDVDDYLQKQGFTFEQGFIDSYGNALAVYNSGENGSMTFSSQPYVRSLTFPKEGSSNVMASGAPFAGMRYDFPSWQVPNSYERSAVEELASICGFTGITDICNNQNMTPPAGTPATNATFTCAHGKMGDLVWTILIVGNGGSTRAVATCAKGTLYTADDLASFSGSVCKYVAYQEVYLSSEYQVHEEKKEGEKKEGEANAQQGNTNAQPAAQPAT